MTWSICWRAAWEYCRRATRGELVHVHLVHHIVHLPIAFVLYVHSQRFVSALLASSILPCQSYWQQTRHDKRKRMLLEQHRQQINKQTKKQLFCTSSSLDVLVESIDISSFVLRGLTVTDSWEWFGLLACSECKQKWHIDIPWRLSNCYLRDWTGEIFELHTDHWSRVVLVFFRNAHNRTFFSNDGHSADVFDDTSFDDIDGFCCNVLQCATIAGPNLSNSTEPKPAVMSMTHLKYMMHTLDQLHLVHLIRLRHLIHLHFWAPRVGNHEVEAVDLVIMYAHGRPESGDTRNWYGLEFGVVGGLDGDRGAGASVSDPQLTGALFESNTVLTSELTFDRF